jgi:leader peptidase (prepilin peptidase)/N-methyltransferase
LIVAGLLLAAPQRLGPGLCLGAALLALAVNDLRSGSLPDILTLPLLLAGIGWGIADHATVDHAAGALLGLAMLALPAFAYERLRGRAGMGWGDVKLAGAAGAWVGWESMPLVLLAAALFGIGAVLLRRLARGTSLSETLPFGPALATATWAIWLAAPDPSTSALLAQGLWQ